MWGTIKLNSLFGVNAQLLSSDIYQSPCTTFTNKSDFIALHIYLLIEMSLLNEELLRPRLPDDEHISVLLYGKCFPYSLDPFWYVQLQVIKCLHCLKTILQPTIRFHNHYFRNRGSKWRMNHQTWKNHYFTQATLSKLYNLNRVT